MQNKRLICLEISSRLWYNQLVFYWIVERLKGVHFLILVKSKYFHDNVFDKKYERIYLTILFVNKLKVKIDSGFMSKTVYIVHVRHTFIFPWKQNRTESIFTFRIKTKFIKHIVHLKQNKVIWAHWVSLPHVIMI